ncbi:MAG: M4 family metallopeptidase, partial [Anaeromyxobacteraceae bacterium]
APARVAVATRHLEAMKASLGVAPRGGFAARTSVVGPSGETIVRMSQTWNGARVWGADAIAHVLADGSVRTVENAVAAGVELGGTPAITGTEAVARALEVLGASGPPRTAPRAELVVFPSDRADDPSSGRVGRAHRGYAGWFARGAGLPSTSPWVWAWEVRTDLRNDRDGARQMTYVVDGNTGVILKSWDALRHVALEPPLDLNGNTWVSAEPTVSVGYGHYVGRVDLQTATFTDAAGGTASFLVDMTRGVNPHPITGVTGIHTLWEQHFLDGQPVPYPYLNPLYAQPVAAGQPNAWGNGLPFTGPDLEGTVTGETLGVDVHHALGQAWDLYASVFFLQGVDNQGTSPLAQVQVVDPWTSTPRAAWDSWQKALFVTAGTWPALPGGVLPLAETDYVGHELFHGVMQDALGLYLWDFGESAGLAEGTADFYGQVLESFTRSPPEVLNAWGDRRIPDGGTDWVLAGKAGAGRGSPLRSMVKPSTDGLSPDAWFEGIARLDAHYQNGPLNRALYFLANGASSNPLDESYSPYLPEGMPGIGLHRSARIWFWALAKYLTGDASYAMAREAAILSARQLYDYDGVEEMAVRRAFAAVNVGDAPGAQARTQVTFPVFRQSGHVYDWFSTRFRRAHTIPALATFRPHAEVLNNPDTRIAWSVPSVANIPSTQGVNAGGFFDADGLYHAPEGVTWYAIQATSVADPRQYAIGYVNLVYLDCDEDSEMDAVDMGAIGVSWFLGYNVHRAHSIIHHLWTDDFDVELFPEALQNAFPVEP